MANGSPNWLEGRWGLPTPEPERPFPSSIYEQHRARWPEEIWEMQAGEAETAGEIAGLLAEMGDWASLRRMLTRPVDKIAQWLAGLEMDRVREKLHRVKEQADISRYKRQLAEGEAKYGEYGAPWGERVTGGPGVRLARAREEAGRGTRREPETAYPIPDWMQAYLEYSMPAGKKGEERGAFALRPLGAQAEPSLEQLGEMASYHTWERAGAPLRYKEYAEAAEMGESWFEEYLRLSRELFPKEVGMRQPRWFPSRQVR